MTHRRTKKAPSVSVVGRVHSARRSLQGSIPGVHIVLGEHTPLRKKIILIATLFDSGQYVDVGKCSVLDLGFKNVSDRIKTIVSEMTLDIIGPLGEGHGTDTFINSFGFVKRFGTGLFNTHDGLKIGFRTECECRGWFNGTMSLKASTT